MAKVKIFVAQPRQLSSVIEHEINQFLQGKKFISLSQSVNHHEDGKILYTVVYEDRLTFGDVKLEMPELNIKNEEHIQFVTESMINTLKNFNNTQSETTSFQG